MPDATVLLGLRDARIPLGNMIGEEGKAFYIMASGLETARAHTAARSIGLARGGLEDAAAYALERKQFERPIGEFQAVQFKLADMATRVRAAGALLQDAAAAVDRGEPATLAASMAKLFASETAMWVTTQAVQVFGGYGYMRDYPVERLFRDAKVTEIYEGTSEAQRIVIARGLDTD